MADEAWKTAFEALLESGMNKDNYLEYLKEFDIIETYKSEMTKKKSTYQDFKSPVVAITEKNDALEVLGEMPWPNQPDAHEHDSTIEMLVEMPTSVVLVEMEVPDQGSALEVLDELSAIDFGLVSISEKQKLGAFKVFDEIPSPVILEGANDFQEFNVFTRIANNVLGSIESGRVSNFHYVESTITLGINSTTMEEPWNPGGINLAIIFTASMAALGKMMVEDSRKLLPAELYPPWVVFSQCQKLNWLNIHLEKIWHYVNEATSQLINSSVQPMLEQYKSVS